MIKIYNFLDPKKLPLQEQSTFSRPLFVNLIEQQKYKYYMFKLEKGKVDQRRKIGGWGAARAPLWLPKRVWRPAGKSGAPQQSQRNWRVRGGQRPPYCAPPGYLLKSALE